MSTPAPGHGSTAGADARVTGLVAFAAAAGYLLFAQFAWRLLDADASPVFFGSAGVSCAALVLTERRRWPWVLAAVGVTELSLDLWHGQALAPALAFTAANTLEPLTGAGLLRRFVRQPDLSQRRDTLLFLTCSVATGPLLGALVGASTLAVAFDRTWPASFLSFWTGDALGVLTVGSTVIAWGTRDLLGETGRTQLLTALATTALTGVITFLGFSAARAPIAPSIGAMLLAAALAGTTGVTTSGMTFAITANVLSARNVGPWGDVTASDTAQRATLQLLLVLALLGPWALAVETAARRRARDSLAAESTARARESLRARLGEALSRAVTVQEVTESIARDGVTALAPVGMVGVLTEEGGRVAAVGVRRHGRDTEIISTAVFPVEADHPLCEATRGGTELVVPGSALGPGVADPADQSAPASALVVPLQAAGHAAAGALAIVVPGRSAGDPETLRDARAVASVAAPALLRALEHQREREVSHRLQLALLPVVPETLGPGLHVAVRYRPADPRHYVGGDWYDAFELPGGRVALVTGDVVGHDLQAATAMGKLQQALRLLTRDAPTPAEALSRLDEVAETIPGALMSTVGLADYDPATRRLRYSCAGHPPPLLVTREGTRFLADAAGLPLGVLPDRRRENGEVELPEPALLLWYTDGLVETRGQGIRAGMARLQHLVEALGPTVRAEDLCTRLLQLPEGHVLPDDVVVLCVVL